MCRHPRRSLPLFASLVVAAACLGCDGGDEESAMVMRPVSPDRSTQTSPPPSPADPIADGATGERFSDPAFFTVTTPDGREQTHEFPPAKLWLKGMTGEASTTVRATLYSDDPEEALRGATGDSFHFDMTLALPPGAAVTVADRLADGGAVRPTDLQHAEWEFRADPDADPSTRSGIYLVEGETERHLKPVAVVVTFDPLGDDLVIVTLVGDFTEPAADDAASIGQGQPSVRRVSARAVLSAEAIRR